MPIEIISKRETQKSPLLAVLVLVLILLGLALIGSYAFFYVSLEQINKDMAVVDKKLDKTPEEKALENELILYETKVNNFASLMDSHKKPANVLAFLDENCLPEVWFSQFDLNVQAGVVSVSGKAKSFIVLEQQMNVLKNKSQLSAIALSGVSMDDTTKEVSFSLQFTFLPQIFK